MAQLTEMEAGWRVEGNTGEGTLGDLGLDALAKSRAGGHLDHLGGDEAGRHFG